MQRPERTPSKESLPGLRNRSTVRPTQSSLILRPSSIRASEDGKDMGTTETKSTPASRQSLRQLLASTKLSLQPSEVKEHIRVPRQPIGPTLWRACGLAKVPPRCFFAFMANIGLAIIYGLKVVLSLAIVVMVNHEASQAIPSDCPVGDSGHNEKVAGPKYEWDSSVEAQIVGSYFYGYLVGQIPGAILADMYSAKWVMWAAVAVNVLGCAFTPIVASVHWGFLVVVRVVQGIAGGVTFPALHIMIANWAPPAMLSIFTGVIYAGTAIGMVGSTLITGFVTIQVGWENMFYIMAGMCGPWLILWGLFIEDTPPLSHRESLLDDDVTEVIHPHGDLHFPAREVSMSMPFWAIMVAHVGGNFGLYCLILEAPSFMKKVLHKDLKENTILTCIPYIAMFVVSNVTGPVLDTMRSKHIITTTTARRIAASICMVIPAVCLIGLSTIECNVILGIMWITIATGATGAQTVGYLGNHIDISPHYAGMLIGITNTVATIPGIVVPVMFGELTKEKNVLTQWSIGFYCVATIELVAYVFYMLFVSGEVQPWDEIEVTDEDATKDMTLGKRVSVAHLAATPPPAPATDPKMRR